MNLSIFNFKNNIKEIKNVLTLKNIILYIFIIGYFYLMFLFINKGFWYYKLVFALPGIFLLAVFIIQKSHRPVFMVILLSGFIFLIIGELFFRLNYFGIDGVIHFNKYISTWFLHPLSAFEYYNNTYTRLKPGYKVFKGKSFYINNLGFRDKDRTFEKKDNTIRIVVCGSSFSMGLGVNQGENYAGHLEKILNENSITGKTYEVINLSMGGFGMSDMIDVLSKYGMKFDPDIILIEAYAWKRSIEGEMNMMAQLKPVNSVTSYLNEALRKPAAVFYFLQAIKLEFILYIKDVALSKVKSFFRNKGILKKDEKVLLIEEQLSNYFADEGTIAYYLDKIKRLTKGKKVFMVSLRPMRFLDMKMQVPDVLKKLTSKYELGFIDTYNENYGTNVKEAIIYIGDRHPNSRIHRIYAESIYKTIKPVVESFR